MLSSILPVCLFLLQVCVCYAFFKLTRFLFACHRIDTALNGIPALEKHFLFGSILQLRREGSVKARSKLFLDNPLAQFAKFYIGPMPVLISRDAEFAKSMLSDKGATTEKFRRLRVPVISALVGSSIIVEDGDEWAHDRKIVSPLFRHENMKKVISVINNHAQRLITLLSAHKDIDTKEGIDVEIEPFFSRLTSGVISFLAFSSDIGALQSTKESPLARAFSNDYYDSIDHMINLPLFLQNLPTKMRKRFDRAVKQANSALCAVIAKRRTTPNTGNESESSTHKDLLDLVWKANMKDEKIHSNSMLMFWAGQETTSANLTWATHFLSLSSSQQRSLQAEVIQAVGDNGEIGFEELTKMPALGRFVNETLRLRPPAATVMRVATHDQVFDGMVIPEGTWALQSIYETHRNKKYWHEPLKFNPDRFLLPTEPNNAFAYLPFSKGAKICVGSRLALIESKIVLAYLIRTFQIEYCPDVLVEEQSAVILKPKQSLRVRLSQRQQ